ncbi:potassium channel family protein [Agrilutibacter solisilvae]|uniref:Two pore domain potassium channel family protein n=1 Tax=Agrilutibacter solisilvae TaxID=2763317 RepID=A0A975AT69_9GAMM|nr:potassium channel family protein [Lysobacter solisilvae]QSX79507.1 two pore domain potassium channel family protein [Lysobacter solisilvae]
MTTTPDLPRERWSARARRHPSAFLLAAQLLSLLLFPVLDGHEGRVVFGGFSVLVLVLAVWVVNRTPSVNWIAWLLAAPACVLSLLSVLFDSQTLLVWSSAFEAAVYFYAAVSLIVYMMSDHRVTTDELLAAGATFTLLAWGFAYLFVVCQHWYPDSFAGAVMPERPRTWLELLFFSFTNLSATGLGDIVPLSPAARVLTMFEQLAGVGYVAVVVSRLIGLSILRASKR